MAEEDKKEQETKDPLAEFKFTGVKHDYIFLNLQKMQRLMQLNLLKLIIITLLIMQIVYIQAFRVLSLIMGILLYWRHVQVLARHLFF